MVEEEVEEAEAAVSEAAVTLSILPASATEVVLRLDCAALKAVEKGEAADEAEAEADATEHDEATTKRIAELNAAIDKAVEEEDYEAADQLETELKELKGRS